MSGKEGVQPESNKKGEQSGSGRSMKFAAPPRILTGIAGLDDILGGGLPQGHLYLVEGDPGTGKTTLGMQFLLEGVRNKENVAYVTLSESKQEIIQVAESHGWSLDGVEICEAAAREDEISAEAQYTVFHPSEVEMADTLSYIVQQVDAVNPQRIVFDSLSEFRLLARDPLKYRRHILGLKRHFAGKNCTVLLLDDGTAEAGKDGQLQSIAHGVLLLQSLERDFGIKRRRIEVRKLRGSAYREGYHDYTIQAGGLSVFPRLIASEHRPGFERAVVLSGLRELDQLFGNGIDSGTSSLFMGPAGCGKSTIALNYAMEAARRGEKALYFTFDESMGTLMDRARGFKMNLEPLLESGLLQIKQVDPAELSPGEFVSEVRHSIEVEKLSVLVIDSINGLMNAMPHEQFLALQLHELLTYLAQQGVATIMTMAQHGFVGKMDSPIDVSYLADTVLLFRYYEFAGEVRQALSVIKKRSGRHERTIRELKFGDGSFSVGSPLKEFQGVLTGVPRLGGNLPKVENSAES